MNTNLAPDKRRRARRWYLYALIPALLLGLVAVAGSTFAAAPAGLPVKQVQATQAQHDAKPPANTGNRPSSCGLGSNYTFSPSPIFASPGVTDIGNHCDNCTTNIPMPFPVRLYKQVFSNAFVSSNGNLQFTSNNAFFSNTCLPFAPFSNTIFPHWDDLRTDAQPNCATYGATGCGIFTQVYGSSPNRTFVIEWRTVLFSGGQPVQFYVILYENQDRFDMAYRTIANQGAGATSGVQKDAVSGLFTQYSCNTPSLTNNLYLVALPVPCDTPTPTPTPDPRTIIVQKLDASTNLPLPGWKMQLFSGPNCIGAPLASQFTDPTGLATFTGLTPGNYSVQEVLQPGYVPLSGVCQNVTVTAQAPSGPGSPFYPPAGDDTFDSPVYASVTINGLGSDSFRLDGPTTVHRGDPCVGCGSGGLTTIDTEITGMQFSGDSTVFGPVLIRESPTRPSLGQIRQQTAGTDFPADSFFDVFADFDTSLGQLYTVDPVHVSSVIRGIPPYGDTYMSSGPVLLYSVLDGQPVGTLNSIKKIPVGPNTAVIIFRNLPFTPTPTDTPTDTPTPAVNPRTIIVQKLDASTNLPLPGWKMQLFAGPNCIGAPLASQFTDPTGLATFTGLTPGNYSVQEVLQPGYVPLSGVCQNVTVTAQAPSGPGSPFYPPAGDDTFDSPVYASVTINGLGSDSFRLDGPTTVHRGDPCVGCGSGGLTTIDTEITGMQFSGDSSVFGPVLIRESPTRPSLGQIRQQTAGTDFPADSFFDVFADFDTSLGQLYTVDPVHVTSVIRGIPPYGDTYMSSGPVLLYSVLDGQPVGTLNSIKKIPVGPNTAVIIFRNLPFTPTPTDTPTNTPTDTPTNTPTDTPTQGPRTIIVQKLDASTNLPLPGWKMQLFAGPNCIGAPLASQFTDPTGLATFTGLTPGNYSVQEVLQPGYIPLSGVCQNVTVAAQAPSEKGPLMYPPAGDDTFDSPVYASVTINGVGSDSFRLDGPTTVHRGDPCVGCGSGGLTTIDTEITGMQFSGDSSVFGPVLIRESPSRPSLGQIRQQTAGTDFPADSFFDVFADFDTSLGQLYTVDPVHVTSVIRGIPPYGDTYMSSGPVLLYSVLDGQPVGTLNSIKKIPVGPNTAVIIFRNLPFTPTPTDTPTATPTVCKPFLVGHVTLQGIPQPDPRNVVKPLTLTLRKPGTVISLTTAIILDNRGVYTINVSTLPPDTYQWRLKGVKYLASCGTLTLVSCPPSINNVEHGTLRAGDVNDDNLVNSIDFTLLKNSFGKGCGQPGFDARADFNNDCIVNTTDFTLLRNNFGFAGCSPILGPSGAQGSRGNPGSVAYAGRDAMLPGRR